MSISEAKHSASNSIDTTNKPDTQDSECLFGDSACGEPLVTQRVSLDFTPNELDNDFVQRKCCAFWEFINMRPELKNIQVVPDYRTEVYSNESKPSVVQPHIFPQRQTSSHSITKTAVDMLEFVEEKGLIDRAFEAKIPKSYCENNRMPSSNVSMTGIRHQLEDNKDLKNKKEKRQTNVKALPKLSIMCNKMHEWDTNHPKSMKPPGPPPALPDDIKLIRY